MGSEDRIATFMANMETLDSSSKYIKWELDLTDFLGMSGYYSLLYREKDGIEVITGESEAEKAKRESTWREKQARVCVGVRHTLGYNARMKVKDKTKVHEIMIFAKKLYRPSSSAVYQLLIRRLTTLSLASCEDI